MTQNITPFILDIPQADLDDLAKRLDRIRWPDTSPVEDGRQGPPLDKIRALVDHWRTAYDWRRCETLLNGLGQSRTKIDGVGIGVKRRRVHCARDDPRRDQCILRQPGDECLRAPFAERGCAVEPLTHRRTPPKAGEVGFDSSFINKDKPVRCQAHPRLTAGDPVPPRLTQHGSVTFGRDQPFFYMTTRRATKRGAARIIARSHLRFRTGQRPVP
ncbi:epoxide hydrolase N-terminal domain-containing protein [Yoonia sp. 67-2]|uniref:epoxide hydrolase N-terminal domain-containing protein n=1 Tax=Yoonia sp. 67-2 TaxID=3081448 RepID=UPI003A5C7FFA